MKPAAEQALAQTVLDAEHEHAVIVIVHSGESENLYVHCVNADVSDTEVAWYLRRALEIVLNAPRGHRVQR